MKILILGASSKKSIGYLAGKALAQEDHKVIYSSRSGALGRKCDITSPDQVNQLLRKTRPNAIINATGLYLTPKPLGKIEDWESYMAHMAVKSSGALILVDAAKRAGCVETVIMVGGRAVSSDPGFAAYTVGNGALGSAVEFASQHISDINFHYLDLPLVKDTSMANDYLMTQPINLRPSILDSSIGMEDANEVIKDILLRRNPSRYPNGSRTILGKPGSL